MNEMTYEQLVSIFGEETAKTMYEQMQANTGGSGAPFPFLKKVSTHGSELGDFGSFVYGVKTEKDAKGNKTVVDKGVNVGSSFEFLPVYITYRYTLWDEAKQKGLRSNMFKSVQPVPALVDAYSGKALPASKEDKKEAGWKLNKIIAGLIRSDSKSDWAPVIWETTGMLYYTLGEVVGSNGILSGVVKVSTKLEAKGSTQFPVVDIEKSSFGPLPKDLFTKDETKAMIASITDDMNAYYKDNQHAQAAPAAPSAPAEEDETNW